MSSSKKEYGYENTFLSKRQFWIDKESNFINDLSKARTYTLHEDIEKMRTAGLAIGGNLNNAIVVDKYQKVRRIHTGFNGPATGQKHENFKNEFELFLEKIIAE